MICLNCGSKIPKNGNFCPECGTLIEEDNFPLEYEDFEFTEWADCLNRFNLSPAELIILIIKPKHLDNYFKLPYRITLFYFILKGILKLEIESSKLILFNLNHISVKKGPLFEKSLNIPLKPYESIILEAFKSGNSFKVDTYEEGPLSYKFESITFKELFMDELMKRDFFEFEKNSLLGLGSNEYVLTANGDNILEEILGQLGYGLEDKFFRLKTPSDLLYILFFFGLDEVTIEEKKSEMDVLHRKLLAIEKVYEGRRGGYTL